MSKMTDAEYLHERRWEDYAAPNVTKWQDPRNGKLYPPADALRIQLDRDAALRDFVAERRPPLDPRLCNKELPLHNGARCVREAGHEQPHLPAPQGSPAIARELDRAALRQPQTPTTGINKLFGAIPDSPSVAVECAQQHAGAGNPGSPDVGTGTAAGGVCADPNPASPLPGFGPEPARPDDCCIVPHDNARGRALVGRIDEALAWGDWQKTRADALTAELPKLRTAYESAFRERAEAEAELPKLRAEVAELKDVIRRLVSRAADAGCSVRNYMGTTAKVINARAAIAESDRDAAQQRAKAAEAELDKARVRMAELERACRDDGTGKCRLCQMAQMHHAKCPLSTAAPTPHNGAHDAVTLLTQDRDEWKRRAETAERDLDEAMREVGESRADVEVLHLLANIVLGMQHARSYVRQQVIDKARRDYAALRAYEERERQAAEGLPECVREWRTIPSGSRWGDAHKATRGHCLEWLSTAPASTLAVLVSGGDADKFVEAARDWCDDRGEGDPLDGFTPRPQGYRERLRLVLSLLPRVSLRVDSPRPDVARLVAAGEGLYKVMSVPQLQFTIGNAIDYLAQWRAAVAALPAGAALDPAAVLPVLVAIRHGSFGMPHLPSTVVAVRKAFDALPDDWKRYAETHDEEAGT